MRPLSQKTHKILSHAELWRQDCLRCGSVGEEQNYKTTAEHAVYETSDGAKTTGAAQSDEAWGIIPLCMKCNAYTPDNDISLLMGLSVGEKLGVLNDSKAAKLASLRERITLDDGQKQRLYCWIEDLKKAWGEAKK